MSAFGQSEVHTILVVDPSQLEQRYTGRLIESFGWRASFARDGVEALEYVSRHQPAVVLTNLLLPQLSGLQLVGKIRDRYPHVPVVLITTQGDERLVVEALKAGAADFVSKQSLATELGPVLERVLSVRQAEHRRFRVLAGLTRRSSQFVLENDPTLVPPLVNFFREDLIEMGLCDLTGATRAGIALEEALLNAIYHGNLEVSSRLRESDDEAFHALAAERRELSPYRDRRVKVTARMSPRRATFLIADEGPGFDVSRIPDPTAPENIDRPCGRGVLLMRTFMNSVRYNATGNQVTLIKLRDRGGDTR
jgi:FixJ family two-component response regulator/anti-sigma regulatory factor (Ser/Thr protein kinase)